MIRRDGSGGDGGLEAYLPSPTGAVEVAIQAKRFDGRLRDAQWRQIDGSIRKALRENAIDGALTKYFVCIDHDLTATERTKWETHVSKWSNESRRFGYQAGIDFALWGAAELRAALLRPVHHGLALYFFDHPNLTLEEIWQVTQTTIGNLGERYLPQLHARTTSESDLYWFVRAASAKETFHEFVRERLVPELHRPWCTKSDWSAAAKPLAASAAMSLASVVDALGDGCSWPSSVTQLRRRLNGFNQSLRKLSSLRRDELENTAETVKEETGYIEGVFLDYSFDRLDCPFMIVLGEAGKGKSHLLAHLASNYVAAAGAVVFVEGGSFISSTAPWQQFLSLIDFNRSVREFLSVFATMASATELPGLICIDALNETPDRNVWLNHLLLFAAELKQYPNLKLLVSCREDYADLTLPNALLDSESPEGWCKLNHHGLDIDIQHAIGQYFKAYNVIGTPAQCFQDEFRTPLFLKLVCEAFRGRDLPVGTLSLTVVFQEYIKQTSQVIQKRLDIRASQVDSALRALVALFVNRGRPALPEQDVRELMLRFHSTTAESKSLLRALLSEGILHEGRKLAEDKISYEIEVRFAYERLWDYFLSAYFWPVGQDVPGEVLAHLKDARWRRLFEGVIRIFAMRLPESGLGEIHAVVQEDPSHTTRLLNSAFIDSLSWRQSRSFSDRTRAIVNVIVSHSHYHVYDLLLRWVMHADHPWNAEYLHTRLSTMEGGLAARDRDWTLWVNEQLAGNGDWCGEQLLVLAEQSLGGQLNGEQTLRLATAVSWMLATTHVSGRRRIARALATLLRDRLDVAVELVSRFESIDDAYIVSGVLFACAAIAHVAPSGDPALSRLAKAVHRIAFGQRDTIPNMHMRFYAANLCETAFRMGCLPHELNVESFRPPFESKWPSIQAKMKFTQWETLVTADHTSYATWSSVLRSTRPYDGDWGHYEMVPTVLAFQNKRLNTRRASDHSKESAFDPFKAQRFVAQRVVEMGLDAKESDETPAHGRISRDRPEVERLGKKYQWIALSELLALLADNYHPTVECKTDVLVPPGVKCSDLYDPAALLASSKTSQPANFLVAEAFPRWLRYPHPFPTRLTEKRRLNLCTDKQIDSPKLMLALSDSINWIPLSSRFEFVEPRPNFLSGYQAGPRARLSWSIRSYCVPNARRALLQRGLSVEEVGGSYNPCATDIESGLELLSKYPDGSSYDEYAIVDDLRTTGAWLTTCPYSNGTDDESVSGIIPSPQLARLSHLRWSGDQLSFCGDRVDGSVFRSFEHDLCSVVAYERDALLELLGRTRHTLFWRIYGWKWVESGNDHHTMKSPSSREYVAVFRMKNDGTAAFVWGSTWLQWPLALRENVIW